MVNAAHSLSPYESEPQPNSFEARRNSHANAVPEQNEITQNRVGQLVGDEMREVAEEEKTTFQEMQTAPEVAPQENPNKDKLQDVERMLQNIEQIVSDLVQKNMEHRVVDLRDRLPIFANIRSHRLAGREGQLIQNLQREAATLQEFVEAQGLQIPLGSLMDKVMTLKIPGGVTKWLATILVTPRTWHRSFMTPRFEAIKAEASDLKRLVQANIRA